MELSRRMLEFWGFDPESDPFGITIHESAGIFVWPDFQEAVDLLVRNIRRRSLIALIGSACSAKSTLWSVARRKMDEGKGWSYCQPHSQEINLYNEMLLLRTIKESLMPDDGSPEHQLRRDRESRARQVRQLLERENVANRPVVLSINDAHECSRRFLLIAKRLWDDPFGYDRLLALLLIGQPGLSTLIQSEREIAQRVVEIRTPGLGSHIQAYLQHELGRCGNTNWFFEDDAIDELEKLRGDERSKDNWLTRRDHPLVINNVVSSALAEAFRVKSKSISRDMIARSIRGDMGAR